MSYGDGLRDGMMLLALAQVMVGVGALIFVWFAWKISARAITKGRG